jgi:hypothetical protein
MKHGLNAAIMDPLDRKLMETLRAAAVLLGQDPWRQAYTRAFRGGKLGKWILYHFITFIECVLSAHEPFTIQDHSM